MTRQEIYWKRKEQDAWAVKGRRPNVPTTAAGLRLSDPVWLRLRARAARLGIPVSQLAEALLRDAMFMDWRWD
jgi:hypothetical protein